MYGPRLRAVSIFTILPEAAVTAAAAPVRPAAAADMRPAAAAIAADAAAPDDSKAGTDTETQAKAADQRISKTYSTVA
jgi:hypothetical protein